jgi:hypothetical protein
MTKEFKVRPPVWEVRPNPVPKILFPPIAMLQFYLVDRTEYLFYKAALHIGAKFKSLERKELPHRGIVRSSYETLRGVTHFFQFDCYAQTQRRFSCCLRFDRQPEFAFSADVLKEPENLDDCSSYVMDMTLAEFCGIVQLWTLTAVATCDN